MLSKNKIKFFKSLQQKKYRDINKLFITEGEKLISELFESGFKINTIIATKNTISKVEKYIDYCDVAEISENDIQRISNLKTSQSIVAIVEIPKKIPIPEFKKDLVVVLDNIQNPGNFGTIIRLADWFGVKNIVCSENTVELYNPKVVQATMGAMCRINVHYTFLPDFLSNYSDSINMPVYGAFMNGKSIYDSCLSQNGFIVMGNEGNGISKEVADCVKYSVSIPTFPSGNTMPESLNVAMATGIICSEFRRQRSM